MAVRMSPNCFGAFAWVRQRSRLEIDRDTRAHWHGPIDEDGQRGRVLLLRPGFEQSREGVGQFFGELAIETLAVFVQSPDRNS